MMINQSNMKIIIRKLCGVMEIILIRTLDNKEDCDLLFGFTSDTKLVCQFYIYQSIYLSKYVHIYIHIRVNQ